jgi:UPF0176 protein
MSSNLKPFLNVTGYKFQPVKDPEDLQTRLEKLCSLHSLRGTVIVAPEGINVALAGLENPMRDWMAEFRFLGFEDFWFKESFSDHLPFDKLQIKLKREIISVRNDSLNPLTRVGQKISPEELKKWLDEGRDFTLLDTRNNYEMRMGSFDKAQDLRIEEFQDFEAKIREKAAELNPDRPVVMFCTGGVRCEKAAFAATDAGFKEVYQLDGGILNYFEKCGGDHWVGECFVFDKRVGVLPSLEESQSVLCWACGEPLGTEDQRSEKYVYKQSCPYCFEEKFLSNETPQPFSNR